MNPLLGDLPQGSRFDACQVPLDSDDDASAIATRGSDPSDEDRSSSMANSIWTLPGNHSELCLGHVGSSFDDQNTNSEMRNGAGTAVGVTRVTLDMLPTSPDIAAYACFLPSMPTADQLPVPPFELTYEYDTTDIVQDVQQLCEYYPVLGFMPRVQGIDLGVQFTHMQHTTSELGVDAILHDQRPPMHSEGQHQPFPDPSAAHEDLNFDVRLHQIPIAFETKSEMARGSTSVWNDATTLLQGSYPSQSSSSYPQSSFADDDLFSFTLSNADAVSESDFSIELSGSFQDSAHRDDQNVPGGISHISPSDVRSGVRLQRRASRKARNAPQHDTGHRHYCNACTEVPGGFLGQHELTRHQHDKHSEIRRVFVCVEPADDSGIELRKPLQECDPCRARKVYDRDYNAVAHLWRMHLNPVARGRRPRGEHGRPGRSIAIAPGLTAMMVKLGWVTSILVDSVGREIAKENDLLMGSSLDLASGVGYSEPFEASIIDGQLLEAMHGGSLPRSDQSDINDDAFSDLELFGPIGEL